MKRLVAALAVAACGAGGEDDRSGTYDVVLVVGEALVDDAADPTGFPGVGSTFEERWELACEDDACDLGRPEGGVVLGDLDALGLAEDDDGRLVGEATGVRPPPALEEPSPCAGSPVERWTVTVELAFRDEALIGSVFREPDALVDGDCFGLDLTLGLSGTRQ